MAKPKPRTHAATIQPYFSSTRSLSSSSGSARYPYINTVQHSKYLLCNGHSIVNCCQPLYQKYNLNDLYNHVIGSTCTEFGGHKESADCCKELLQCIVNKCENHDNITIAVERQIPNLSNSEISDLMCSNHQIPDLYMHLSDDLTAETIVEIHSSPYEDTLRKALICATDLLRLRRMYSDKNKITAFCFPKLRTKNGEMIKENKQCVVKLEITWKEFMFQYCMTPIGKIEEVEENIIPFSRILQLSLTLALKG